MTEALTFGNKMVVSGHLLDMGTVLFLYMHDIDFKDAFDLLATPENVLTIRWERYGQTGEVTGYGHLYTITEERDGIISAGILKI